LERPRVLVAGVGGASLGTEVLKALRLADRYTAFACDISPLAFGHYVDGVEQSFVVDADDYVASVLDVCRRHEIAVIVAGAEGATIELNAGAEAISSAGVTVAGNAPEVIRVCGDKARLFEHLRELGVVDLPWTASAASLDDLRALGDLPDACVVKPARRSGGSSLVFLGTSPAEVETYVRLLTSLGHTAVIQEYVSLDEGEFTIGVLSLPDGTVAGSIALQRLFHTKLSVLMRSSAGVISSGYSQGLIADFPELQTQAEQLAEALGSRGPLNVQARIRDGTLIPFEINPRFSASTYLRSLAGFNEVDAFLRHILFGDELEFSALRPGYYLRSLDEVYVPLTQVKS
jgi:carbamoyl-phosphate synthase large subunit